MDFRPELHGEFASPLVLTEWPVKKVNFKLTDQIEFESGGGFSTAGALGSDQFGDGRSPSARRFRRQRSRPAVGGFCVGPILLHVNRDAMDDDRTRIGRRRRM